MYSHLTSTSPVESFSSLTLFRDGHPEWEPTRRGINTPFTSFNFSSSPLLSFPLSSYHFVLSHRSNSIFSCSYNLTSKASQDNLINIISLLLSTQTVCSRTLCVGIRNIELTFCVNFLKLVSTISSWFPQLTVNTTLHSHLSFLSKPKSFVTSLSYLARISLLDLNLDYNTSANYPSVVLSCSVSVSREHHAFEFLSDQFLELIYLSFFITPWHNTTPTSFDINSLLFSQFPQNLTPHSISHLITQEHRVLCLLFSSQTPLLEPAESTLGRPPYQHTIDNFSEPRLENTRVTLNSGFPHYPHNTSVSFSTLDYWETTVSSTITSSLPRHLLRLVDHEDLTLILRLEVRE